MIYMRKRVALYFGFIFLLTFVLASSADTSFVLDATEGVSLENSSEAGGWGIGWFGTLFKILLIVILVGVIYCLYKYKGKTRKRRKK